MHMESTLGGSFSPHGSFSPVTGDHPSSRGNGIDSSDIKHVQARISSSAAEVHELRAELERLRADRDRMAEILSRLTEVLGSKSPDRLVHDVRNVLNERELYRALADSTM